jgi:hypothetical protein
VYNTTCVQHYLCPTLPVYNTTSVQHYLCTTLPLSNTKCVQHYLSMKCLSKFTCYIKGKVGLHETALRSLYSGIILDMRPQTETAPLAIDSHSSSPSPELYRLVSCLSIFVMVFYKLHGHIVHCNLLGLKLLF